jgi:hypothetical protein
MIFMERAGKALERIEVRDFKKGWLVGNFEPTLYHTGAVEVGLKSFRAGETEPAHFQRIAHELSVVVTGRCRLGDMILEEKEGVLIPPLEVADFEALTDCEIIVVKWPSIAEDKELA